MSRIIAARFTTFDAADTARKRLLANQFVQEDVAEFFVNPSGQHARYPSGGDAYADPQARPAGIGATSGGALGAVVGAAVAAVLTFLIFHSVLVVAIATLVGTYIGTLIGALVLTRGGKRADEPEPVPNSTPHERESGVMLAVHVNPAMQSSAIRVLQEANAKDIEIASGNWHDGRWADFDPTRMVNPLDSDGAAPASAKAETR